MSSSQEFLKPELVTTRNWAHVIKLNTENSTDLEGSEAGDIAILPRRKAGESNPRKERAAVVLTRTVLEGYFEMPLSAAAKELVRFNHDLELGEWKVI